MLPLATPEDDRLQTPIVGIEIVPQNNAASTSRRGHFPHCGCASAHRLLVELLGRSAKRTIDSSHNPIICRTSVLAMLIRSAVWLRGGGVKAE